MTSREVLTLENEKFEINEKLGQGGFATVFRATRLDSNGRPCLGRSVAIKKIDQKDDKWKKHEPFVRQEIEIHEKLDHKNIVKLYKHVEVKNNATYLILELCSKGSVHHYRKKHKQHFDEYNVYDIFKQIVDGVQYLHSRLIIHRDLTLRNILLTEKMQVKIADFGLSTTLKEANETKYTKVGTHYYMPPEMDGKNGHNDKADVWNLGCILYALLVGELPKRGNITYPDHISYEAKELLQNLLEKDPAKRTCIEAVPNFEFFKKYERISKSKNSVYRSDDSGNGSRNHLSTQIENESHFRSCDSGFNSKNSSSKKNKLSNKIYYLEEKLAEKRNFDLQKNKLLPMQNCYLSSDRIHGRKRCASEDRKPYNPLSCSNSQQVFNSHERSVSAERERIGDLKLSYRHDYTSDACRIISSDCYKSKGRYTNKDCGISSTWKTHRSCNAETTEHCNDPSCRFSNSLLEGQHNVSPSTCSHAGCFDTKCSHVATCCCHSHSHHKHALLNINNPEKLNEHSLEQKTSPLNAARLRPKRHKPKDLNNTVLHISEDRQVIMEILKTKKGKVYVSEVFTISTDGMEIKMYKPPKNTLLDDNHPPPFPSDSKVIKSYDYQKLPKMYHGRYLVAKQFVDILRAKKPKLIINGQNARFYVMENSPDPDMKMEFYDGGSVIKKDQIISITDKFGKECKVYDVTKNLDKSLNSMLEEFLSEKEDCERILKFHESLRSPNFPIVIGTIKSDLTCSGQKTGKENLAPVSSRHYRM